MSTPSLLIISAPSGAGKTSLARELVRIRDDVALTVSHTTRARRPGEQHGVDYFFVAAAEFESMVRQNLFVEHAVVFGNRYGTSQQTIRELLAAKKHALLEIDWQGARAVRQQFPEARSVFIMPPSLQTLRQRLQARNQDDPSVIAARMLAAQGEIAHKDEYQFIIVNDDFQTALAELERVLRQD